GKRLCWRAQDESQKLHNPVERTREGDLVAAQRFLAYLAVSPAFRAVQSTPINVEEIRQEMRRPWVGHKRRWRPGGLRPRRTCSVSSGCGEVLVAGKSGDSWWRGRRYEYR